MLISLEGRNELNNFVFSRSSRQYLIQSKKIIEGAIRLFQIRFETDIFLIFTCI